jgi:hypothetical protein
MPAAGMAHPRVRQFLNIKHNRSPNPNGGLALEGLWAIERALAADVPIEVVFVCPALSRGDASAVVVDALRTAGTHGFEVSERVLRRLVDRDGPDGARRHRPLATAPARGHLARPIDPRRGR